MRFHYGEIPKAADFDPGVEGWESIREPGPLLLNLLSIPTAILLLSLTIWLMMVAGGGEALVIWQESAIESASSPFLPILAIVILSIPVHELMHALAHPHYGLSSNSILGLWLSRGLFYAHYEGEMSRNRFLMILAFPYLILSLLPIASIALIGLAAPATVPTYLAVAALINSILVSGDAVGFVLLLSQVPSAAVVRNKGWRSYWR